jgi:membrane protein required for colicin V production
LSKVDIILAIILLVGTVIGYKRGFLMELFFLVAIVLGVFLGFKLMAWGVEYLSEKFNADKAVLPYISFALIFLLVMVIVTFIGKRIKNSLDKTFLGQMDSAAGALLGLIKYAFCISIIIWLAESFKIDIVSAWGEESKIYGVLEPIAPMFSSLFGDFLPFFKETFSKF